MISDKSRKALSEELTKDGGLASPLAFDFDGERFVSMGMSLRDYFAAKAMQGDIAVNGLEGREVEMVAGMSYEMADAMLKARERK